MNGLITAALDAGDFEIISRFPTSLINEQESKIISWCNQYRQKHGVLPNVERVVDAFPMFVPIRPEYSRPLTDEFDIELKNKRRAAAVKALNDALVDLEEGEIPDAKIGSIAQLLATTSSEITRYTDFDRSVYFRSGSRIYTGFPIIDRAMGGLSRGDLFTIVGRLGTGKTTLALWLIFRWLKQGKKILVISNEMSLVDVYSRLDAMFGKFNPVRFRNVEDYPDMEAHCKNIQKLVSDTGGDIIIPSARGLTPSGVANIAQHLNVDVIFVDGIYLMKPDHYGAGDKKHERVSDVSNALKRVAMDLNVPIISVTQMKRGTDKDMPSMEDLAFSDAIGQDSDFVLFLIPDEVKKNEVELNLMKNRYGKSVSSLIRIDFDRMKLHDESSTHEDK